MKFRSLGDVIYNSVFMHCIGDWNKVMEGGPWAFRGCRMILVPYDGFMQPSAIELNCFNIWIQIHNVPNRMRTMIKPLAMKLGKFIAVDEVSNLYGNFYRA